VEFQEQVNMIHYNFHGMNFVALLHANIFEDQLAILFHLPRLSCQVQPHNKKKQRFIDLREHKERARVHFIPELKVGVFVTLRIPDVINR
jgi:hypothetical protein